MKSTLVCYSLLVFGGAMAIAPDLGATSFLSSPQNQVAQIQSIRKISQSTSRTSFETELLKLTNLERKKVGLSPLKLSPQLTKAAQFHAVDMARNNYFSHTGLNGSSMVDRAKGTGYKYSALGENIAAGKSTPEGTIRQWMNSSGHRANILNAKFTEIGFGYENAPNSRYRHYWVQVFGTPQR
ncbi:CAP domain-containing protein [Pseudanabaena minima]|uniref:CAP domain-containing protein n=1 Tax=Pseudanabaena minima TaxID=890415 RepID=UPI003DA7BEA2